MTIWTLPLSLSLTQNCNLDSSTFSFIDARRIAIWTLPLSLSHTRRIAPPPSLSLFLSLSPKFRKKEKKKRDKRKKSSLFPNIDANKKRKKETKKEKSLFPNIDANTSQTFVVPLNISGTGQTDNSYSTLLDLKFGFRIGILDFGSPHTQPQLVTLSAI